MNFFTELKIQSFQRTAFAHSLVTPHYDYSLDNRGYGVYDSAPANGGILEVGFVEQNPVILKNEEDEIIIHENCIFILPPASRYKVKALNEGLHRHTSIEFLIRGQWKRTSSYTPADGKNVTLPLFIPPCNGSSEIFNLIRSMVYTKITRPQRSYFEECADFMLLIHRLDQLLISLDLSKDISPGNRRYCERAKTYVSEHIHKKISVGEVAAEIGISKNYLTNVFSNNEGIGLVEYINRRKLSSMLEYMQRYHYNVSQAGEQVGFTDSNYISRIFKRYYGMTFTEYRRTKFAGEKLNSSPKSVLTEPKNNSTIKQ